MVEVKLWPNNCFISRLTYARMGSFNVSFEKAKIFCAFEVIRLIQWEKLKSEDMSTSKYGAFSSDPRVRSCMV